MDKKIAGLLGAVAGIATMASAQAATGPTGTTSATPTSYADLLAPIANPVKQLEADNAARAKAAEVQEAQYYPRPYYRHHHHHHVYYRHHHHHHHGVVIGVPGAGVVIR
jgi:hypothetical protein